MIALTHSAASSTDMKSTSKVRTAGGFGVSLLGEGQEELARRLLKELTREFPSSSLFAREYARAVAPAIPRVPARENRSRP